MSDTSRMYELEYPSPSVGGDDASGPALIIAMQGYADAGHAVEGAAEHLKAALESRTLATFSNDELIDYRSRRPAVTISQHEITDIDDLQLDLRVLRDTTGTSFLLLSGPEPDLKWEAFSKAVSDLVQRFDVSKTICLYAAPMGAPHTRPLVVSAHGNSAELVGRMYTFDGMVTVPGAAAILIERELHKQGKPVAGFTAHVPHYVASSPYPHATFQLLQSIEDATKLQFPLRAIEGDITRVTKQLTEQMEGSAEIAHVVHALEEHYDKEMNDYRERHPQAMMPGEAQVPSGEEISEAFENYLTAIEDRDRVLGQDEQQLSLPFGDDENSLLMEHFLIDPDEEEPPADEE
ncbi:proteasome assembly chaperone [Corynebacterium imitans]|uniref:Proteasome assembly chaperone n=1 Tax=Corynebacterium imitans TaxID=156978 RepID=A0A239ZT45_9CORY|nr:PAC2 family protein [Corynebacterium imitans]MCG7277586.1 PAC2 family protein [Corynebacterium imitans]SNV74391.1 proteasome assembly chaperone [Corynebacterium imitans]